MTVAEALEARPRYGCVPVGRTKPTLREIKPIHSEILRRLALGQKNVEIARDLKIHPQTVCNVKAAPAHQKQLAKLQTDLDANVVCDEARKHIKRMTPELVDQLDRLRQADDTPAALQAKISFDLLKVAGLSPITQLRGQVDHSVAHVQFTPADIEELKRRADAADNPPPPIDVTPVSADAENKKEPEKDG